MAQQDQAMMTLQALRAYIVVGGLSATTFRHHFVILWCLAISSPSAWAQAAELVEIRGRVSGSNMERLAELIDQNLDGDVSLNISVRKSTSEEEDLQADVDGGRLVLYKKAGDSEIVVRSGFLLVGGHYVLRGTYRIKSGGVHQGVASYGLRLIKAGSTDRKRKSGLKVVCLDEASGDGSPEKHRECR